MIDNIKYIISTETNPYKNLALEEYLLKQVDASEVILYLWQNEKTVVIGKNQNPWKECRITELEAEGGKLVRRLSGGGAVFHDLGNLNFTFLATKENYNVEKQLEVILKAVNRLGIPAEKSGRNDITVEGRKFSGNAFYSDGTHCYHHGTILVNVDMGMLSRYLNVSRDKLVSKGVESVRSRVINLTEHKKDLNISKMSEELLQAFQEVYELSPTKLDISQINQQEITRLEDKFSSWDWIYGKKMEFSYFLVRRFPWGDMDMRFVIASGKVVHCVVYSDALETEFFEQFTEILSGCSFSSPDIIQTMKAMQLTPEREMIRNDLIRLIREARI